MQSLFDQAPQERTTVVTEGGRLVVVDVELVRHIDAEALVDGLGVREEKSCGQQQMSV